ncbi:MAG TPA: hypothetical protein VFK89_00875 [Actinomycetota bacterium]|nr:hypothetical protein [Actinomycetota bacterium]
MSPLRRIVLGTVGILVLLALIAESASAHDHKPPRVVLRSGHAEQRARLGTYCWTSAADEPGFFSTICADAVWSFPRAERAKAGKTATITIYKTTAADKLHLTRWRSVDENGYPMGDGRRIRYDVAPTTIDGSIAYEVTFELPSRPGHLYIDMFGRWADTEGAGNEQDADYTMHLKLH